MLNVTQIYINKLQQSLGVYSEFYKIEIEGNIILTEDEFYCASSWIKYFLEHLENSFNFIPPQIQLPYISKNTIIDFGLSHILHKVKGESNEKFVIYIKGII